MNEQNQIALRFLVFCGDDSFQTSNQESWNSAHPMHINTRITNFRDKFKSKQNWWSIVLIIYLNVTQ